jgi:hypothetical protein
VPAEASQAKQLCKRLSAREHLAPKPARRQSDWSYVAPWMGARWSGRTLQTYQIRWAAVSRWLEERRLRGPGQILREHCLAYPEWRKVNRNTAILELRFFAMALEESVQRGWLEKNPARNLRLERTPSKEKRPPTDAGIAAIEHAFERGQPYAVGSERFVADKQSWLYVSFLLGRYQASRLRQAAAPIGAFDLSGKIVHWPRGVMKRGKAFTQPLDPRIIEPLRLIISRRTVEGHKTLCDFPSVPSLHWRGLLREIGITGISHHSFRVRWISEAAKAGWPEAAAMRFSNHSASDVHRIYMKFSASDVAEMLKRLQT